MSYTDLVYRLGKRYNQARQQNPNIEYPEISGNLSDLLGRTALNDLPPLQGEYTIAYYDNQGTNHLLHVYFEEGTYEATGTPSRSGFQDMSVSFGTD